MAALGVEASAVLAFVGTASWTEVSFAVVDGKAAAIVAVNF